MRIDSEAFAELFGFYGDLMQRKAGHVTKDLEVHEELLRILEKAFGHLETSKTLSRGYLRTYSTTLVQHLLGIGGLDTNTRQLLADNPAPLFLFTASDEKVRAYLRSLFESEGGVSFQKTRNRPGSVDLHQAVLCNPPQDCIVPRHPKRISYRATGFLENLLDTPPRVLTAASLLLLRFNINNRLWPGDLYMNDLNEKVMRWRIMITGPDIEEYRQNIGFITKRKQDKLQPS